MNMPKRAFWYHSRAFKLASVGWYSAPNTCAARSIANNEVRIVASLTLIAKFLVHDIEQRLAPPEPLEIFDEQPHCTLFPVGRVIGRVRRKQYVIQPVERMARRQRLFVEDIERRAANLPAF